ncbi:MAG: hypothetical protein GF364_13635 [Candidatus Lokiarchaeota archaeon]|nr:hypothetical protein [Candidatus Lokiarchaeota archaeon]
MSPTINIGDVVYYTHIENDIDDSGIEIGDIIVIKGPQYFYENGLDPYIWSYINNGTPIIHRAINKHYNEVEEEWYFETKGDNNEFSDGCLRGIFDDGYGTFDLNFSNPILVPETEIIGIVHYIIPWLGYLGLYFNVACLFIIGIILIIILKDYLGISMKIVRKKK